MQIFTHFYQKTKTKQKNTLKKKNHTNQLLLQNLSGKVVNQKGGKGLGTAGAYSINILLSNKNKIFTLGWPSRRTLCKTWQNFQLRMGLLDKGSPTA